VSAVVSAVVGGMVSGTVNAAVVGPSAWNWAGALAGAAVGLGLALVVVGLPLSRRPGLMERLEPDYPADLNPKPPRYKSGYGQEPFVITPPWSTLTAYDLNTGTIKWQTPYGDEPEAGPSDKLRGNINPKSGFVILASGLVVFVDNQSKMYVLDQNTGKVVFSRNVPNAAEGVPAVYEANGREYILFALTAGPAFSPGSRMPPGGVIPPAGEKSYVAFALPK